MNLSMASARVRGTGGRSAALGSSAASWALAQISACLREVKVFDFGPLWVLRRISACQPLPLLRMVAIGELLPGEVPCARSHCSAAEVDRKVDVHSSLDQGGKSRGACQGLIFGGKPLTRFELVTSPLPRECSTTELQGHVEGGPGWLALKSLRRSEFAQVFIS
jgi:hypothetical protein